jgi:hypothetical protein
MHLTSSSSPPSQSLTQQDLRLKGAYDSELGTARGKKGEERKYKISIRKHHSNKKASPGSPRQETNHFKTPVPMFTEKV